MDSLPGITVLSAHPITLPRYLTAIWDTSEILRGLIWRDLKLRFKHRYFAALSALLQPLIATGATHILLSQWRTTSATLNQELIGVLIGMVVWQFFSRSLMVGGTCLRHNSDALSRHYYPRLLMPLAILIAGLLDFFIASLSIVLALLLNDLHPTASGLAILGGLTLLMITAGLGISLWCCLLDYEYDDIGHMLPFVCQIGFFVTPIMYGIGHMQHHWQMLLALNPFTVVIEGTRAALFSTTMPHIELFLISGVVSVGLLSSGVFLFCVHERSFGERIPS